ncbi:MAG: GyrI-like domain-containing protein [Bacteroidota bacterium]|jgi:AraC family transcriptional regulator
MTPRIETIPEKKFIGMRMSLSYADYRIGELWSSFMPRRKEIKNPVSTDLFGITIYRPAHFEYFNPANTFEKWAAVEVTNDEQVPLGLETLAFKGGHYAIFTYVGPNTGIAAFYQYIFTEWLPNSAYMLDDRPHVEVLGHKYKNNDPASEEDIWIPILPK